MKGWICYGTDSDERYLRRIGVKLGEEDVGGQRECEMSEESFKKLEPQWGRFYWSLQ